MPTYSWPLGPTDLQVFLGVSSIDTDRAAMILELAQDLCESIISPLPSSAAAVVLVVAGRAYSNPQQLADASIGSAHLQFGQTAGGGPIGSLYLSRSDKANLRRLAGGSSAFGTSMLPVGVNAVQTLTIAASAGTFTLGFGGAVTSPLAPNVTAGDLTNALVALGTIGAGNASVAGANPFAITFINDLATTDVPPLVVDATLLTGTVTVVTTTSGVQAPGQGLPAWDRDYRDYRILGSQVFGGPL